jgi:hypothetical protein
MASAAATLVTLHNPDAVLPPPTLKEVLAAARAPDGIITLLLARRLLAPLHRTCPRCAAQSKSFTLHAKSDTRYSDGVRLRCYRCMGDWSVRHGSFFEHYRGDLGALVLVATAFDTRMQIAHAARLSGLSEDVMRDMYRDIRQRVWQWLERNPVLFDEDDIVEIDEMYIKQLQPHKDEHAKPVWIIGMIARDNGKVALEVAEDHTMETMKRVINKHLHRSTTITLSDKHASFKFLERERMHLLSEKRHGGHDRMWVVVDEIHIRDHYGPGYHATFGIHTNTIEGFWAHCRRELRGAQANTLHLYLAEIMFRRLRLPITHVLLV